jgi:hypothetical protein
LSGTDDQDDEDAFDRHRAYFIFYIFNFFARLASRGFSPASIQKKAAADLLSRFKMACWVELHSIYSWAAAHMKPRVR